MIKKQLFQHFQGLVMGRNSFFTLYRSTRPAQMNHGTFFGDFFNHPGSQNPVVSLTNLEEFTFHR